jgi:hypothetical protein
VKKILNLETGDNATMSLKSKAVLEKGKEVTEKKLADRLSFLKGKGWEEVAIKRDIVIKKLKGQIRKADYRLSTIASLEKLIADKARAKAEKLAAKKAVIEEPPAKKAKGASAKKEKREKKPQPVAADDED